MDKLIKGVLAVCARLTLKLEKIMIDIELLRECIKSHVSDTLSNCVHLPRRSDRFDNSRVDHSSRHLYHYSPYHLVGNKRESGADIDRMGAEQLSRLHRSLSTKCPTRLK